MKILFVEPRGAFANVFEKSMSIPMLGPVYLATILGEAGFDVSIINENILNRKISEKELASADILCVSCMTATVNRGKEIAREYKTIRDMYGKRTRSIIGGIHASMLPEDVANDFDQVFVGEAENDIIDVITGVRDEKIVYGSALKNLDDLPIPDFTYLKGWEKMKVVPIMTSRGCPYDCNFCSVTEMFGRGYRTRSIDYVIEEFARHQDKKIFFADDHFVVDKKRAHALLDRLAMYDYSKSWSAQLRTEVSKDEALVRKMKNAGCNMVYIGLESVNQKSLDEIQKKQSVEDIKRSVQVFQDNGIHVHGMFMLGSDSDDKHIFKATSEFCLRSGITSAQYLILTPLPGTALYRRLEKENRILHRNWEYYDAMHVVFNPKNFTPAELQQGMIECFSDFYSYTESMNEAVNAVFDSIAVFFKKLYSRTRFPSLMPALIKLFGHKIVKNWIAHNQNYLAYLNNLEIRRHNLGE